MRSLALLALGVLMAAATVRAVEPAFVGTDFAWIEKPRKVDIQAAYPRAAKKAHIGGFVLLACNSVRQGKLVSCRVVQEEPAGQGFGVAAIYVGLKLRAVPVAGDQYVVHLPIWFEPR